MSLEENKALVRRFVEGAWSKGNLAVIDELLAHNFALRSVPPPGVTPDREGYKKWASLTQVSYVDSQTTVEDIIAEGDKVVTRWIYQGIHKGEIWGIAPTGKQVTMTGISIDRIENGKITEEWIEMDMMGMMQQLGVVTPPK